MVRILISYQLLFSCQLLLLSFTVTSQSYHPLLEENKYWVVEYDDYGSIIPEIWQETYMYQGDTLIDSIQYKNFGVLMREDTIERKVYRIDIGNECLLYDFNAQLGDTFEVCHFQIIIDSVSMIEINTGEMRKIFYYSGANNDAFYIEGVGSNKGLFNLSEAIGPPAMDLMCVTKDSIDIYGSRCDQVTGFPEKMYPVIHLQANPNPFTTSTTLSYTLSEPATVTISIFNPQGQLIEKIEQEQTKGEQQVRWNAEGLPSGMYYFRIQAGEMVGGGKIVKMSGF